MPSEEPGKIGQVERQGGVDVCRDGLAKCRQARIGAAGDDGFDVAETLSLERRAQIGEAEAVGPDQLLIMHHAQRIKIQ